MLVSWKAQEDVAMVFIKVGWLYTRSFCKRRSRDLAKLMRRLCAKFSATYRNSPCAIAGVRSQQVQKLPQSVLRQTDYCYVNLRRPYRTLRLPEAFCGATKSNKLLLSF